MATKPPTLLTIPAVAARLGCSRGHVYTLIAAGDLDATDIAPATSTRPKTRVPEASLAAYIEGRTTNARRLRTAS